jgi:hypothetical protein
MSLDSLINGLKPFTTISGLNEISQSIFEDDFVQDWVIETIQERLFLEGKISDLQRLRTDFGKSQRFRGKAGFYSRTTEFIKGKTGQPINRVTLKDSGKFYNSFRLNERRSFYNLSAKFRKKDGHIFKNFSDSFNSEKDFEDAILSLTDEEKDLFLTQIFRPRFHQRIINAIRD